jgi:hypothetical protein
MGAWGHGVFDNDTACDWGSDLVERNDLSAVETALDNVHGVLALVYLDADVASEGLAACEVVARMLGERSDSDGFMKDIDRWIAAHRSLRAEPLVGRAISAIDRVMRQPSELLGLWDEVPDRPKFHATVAELRARLAKHGSSGSAKPWWQFW